MPIVKSAVRIIRLRRRGRMKECVPWHTNCEGSCSSQRCCDGKLRTHIGGNVIVQSTRVYGMRRVQMVQSKKANWWCENKQLSK